MSKPITISCYWNPCEWKSRKKNYERFRNALGDIPHATIELTQENKQEIKDAKIVVKSKSWMWHKERLLNLLAWQLIKEGYDKIIWLDADIEFEDSSWFHRCCNALDKYPVIQPFMTYSREKVDVFEGAVYRYLKTGQYQSRGSGFACAINLDLWKHGLFELGLLGGGDVMFLKGCLIGESNWFRTLKMNPFFPKNKEWLDFYKQWCRPQRIICLDGQIVSFDHGSVKDKQYTKRHPLRYGPDDIEINEDGVFEWKDMNFNKYCHQYMLNRQEDYVR